MIARTSWIGRLGCLLILGAFLGATEGQALGLKPCPYHDAVPESHEADDPEPPAPEEASLHSLGDSDVAAQHPSHPKGPCTCLDDCHVGTSSAAAPTDTSLLAASPLPLVPASTLRSDGSLRGPRHHLFELHLPNAPPSTA